MACPLQADETEQAMLDRISLAGTRGIVAHGNDKAVNSGNGLVETVFPKARPVAIAASAVTE